MTNQTAPTLPDLRDRFGRVVDILTGNPTLRTSRTSVLEVLEHIDAGRSTEQILALYPYLEPADLDACRAYQARYLSDTLIKAFNLEANTNFFLVDENMSYMLLFDVVRNFGRSSHVYADGLRFHHNDDDRFVYQHAVDHGYEAILTSDNDFKMISRNRRRPILTKYGSIADAPHQTPTVVHMSNNLSREEVAAYLEHYADTIKQCVAENDCAYIKVGPNGVWKHYTDASFNPETGEFEGSPVPVISTPNGDGVFAGFGQRHAAA